MFKYGKKKYTRHPNSNLQYNNRKLYTHTFHIFNTNLKANINIIFLE